MSARPLPFPRRLAALAVVLALAACGKSARELPGCSTRAGCAATEVCQGGFCQADQVRPTVLGHVPVTDAANVWWSDAITIDFDEPIDPASVTDGSLLVTAPGGGNLARTWTISGSSLEVRLPQPPADLSAVRLSLSLSGQLRDPAGNLLQGAPVTWGWELPAWQEPAPPFDQGIGSQMVLSHAVAPDGSVLLAWQDTVGPGSPPEVRRAAAGSWVSLGRASRAAALLYRAGSSLAVDAQGRPLVAYVARTGSFSGAAQLFVDRHDGSAWVPLGDALNADTARDASGPRLRLDSGGQPVVLWAETMAPGTAKHLFARRWNGAGWDLLGGEVPTDAARNVTAHALAAGAGGALSLAFADGSAIELRRLESGAWSQPGPNLASTTSELQMIFDGAGLEVVGYADAAGVQVARWREGGIQSRLVPLGTALAASGAAPTLAWRPGGQAGQQLVAGAPGSLMGWDGAAWIGLGALPQGSLSVNAAGVLACVGATNFGPETYRVTAARFNR